MAQEFRRIDVAGARDVMSRGETLVLDVRDPESFRRGHIEGAENTSQDELNYYLFETPKETPVIVCCYHGNSSQSFARIFAEMGFAEVYSLDGGYEAWAAAEKAASGA